MSILKNFQDLQAYANFSMSFTEYIHLPIFAMREFEKNAVQIKEDKSKVFGNMVGN